MKKLALLLLLPLIFGCAKEPTSLTGVWGVKKQVDSWYSSDSLIRQTVFDELDITWTFNSDGTGLVESCALDYGFTYVFNGEHLVLTTSFCPKSTWYVFERSDSFMAMEFGTLNGFKREMYFYLKQKL